MNKETINIRFLNPGAQPQNIDQSHLRYLVFSFYLRGTNSVPIRNERKDENRKENGHERRSDNDTLFLYLSNCRISVDQTSGIKISF